VTHNGIFLLSIPQKINIKVETWHACAVKYIDYAHVFYTDLLLLHSDTKSHFKLQLYATQCDFKLTVTEMAINGNKSNPLTVTETAVIETLN